MAVDGQTKSNFERTYMGYNPARFEGPTTLILDTILLPSRKPKDDNAKSR